MTTRKEIKTTACELLMKTEAYNLSKFNNSFFFFFPVELYPRAPVTRYFCLWQLKEEKEKKIRPETNFAVVGFLKD